MGCKLSEVAEVIRIAQDSYEWQVVVTRVTNFCFHKIRGTSSQREQPSAYQQRLWSEEREIHLASIISVRRVLVVGRDVVLGRKTIIIIIIII
jgi:hypothetical protein